MDNTKMVNRSTGKECTDLLRHDEWPIEHTRAENMSSPQFLHPARVRKSLMLTLFHPGAHSEFALDAATHAFSVYSSRRSAMRSSMGDTCYVHFSYSDSVHSVLTLFTC